MKFDLSVPAIREIVVSFSATLKIFRNRVENLEKQNKDLQSQLFHTRCVAIDAIMSERNCSWEEASKQLDETMNHRRQVSAVAAATIN